MCSTLSSTGPRTGVGRGAVGEELRQGVASKSQQLHTYRHACAAGIRAGAAAEAHARDEVAGRVLRQALREAGGVLGRRGAALPCLKGRSVEQGRRSCEQARRFCPPRVHLLFPPYPPGGRQRTGVIPGLHCTTSSAQDHPSAHPVPHSPTGASHRCRIHLQGRPSALLAAVAPWAFVLGRVCACLPACGVPCCLVIVQGCVYRVRCVYGWHVYVLFVLPSRCCSAVCLCGHKRCDVHCCSTWHAPSLQGCGSCHVPCTGHDAASRPQHAHTAHGCALCVVWAAGSPSCAEAPAHVLFPRVCPYPQVSAVACCLSAHCVPNPLCALQRGSASPALPSLLMRSRHHFWPCHAGALHPYVLQATPHTPSAIAESGHQHRSPIAGRVCSP